MTTTTQLRSWWAPACEGPFSTVSLHGTGRVTVRSSVVPAVVALNSRLKAHNYQTRRADTGGYNCRKITGGTGYSLHAYGTAIDINWQSNPYGPRLVTDMPAAMIADIKAIRTRNGKQVWRWGGNYSGNKDAMHFEVCCSPADLGTGIAAPTAPPPEDDMTPEQVQMLKDVKALASKAALDAKAARDIAQAVFDRQVPEATVREDIELTRKVAAKVGVPAGDIPGG